MSDKIGIKCVFSINSATGGTAYATPTFNNATSVLDATLSLTWDAADASTRATRLKLSAKTMLDAEVTLKVKVTNGADYTALYAATFTDDALDCLILDGPLATDGSEGIRAYFQVMSKSQDQGGGVTVYDEFSLKPANGPNLPKKAVVASGAVTYTDIAL